MSYTGTVQLPNEAWINAWQFCNLLAKSKLVSTPLGRHIAQWAYEEPSPSYRPKMGRPQRPRMSTVELKVRAANRKIGPAKLERCWEALADYIATEIPPHRRSWWPVELVSPAWEQIWSHYNSVHGEVAGSHRKTLRNLLSKGKLQVRDDYSDFDADKDLPPHTSISMISALKYLAVNEVENVMLLNVSARTLILSRGHIAASTRIVPEDQRPQDTPKRISLHLAEPLDHKWHRYALPPRDVPDPKWLETVMGKVAASARPKPVPLDVSFQFVQPYHASEPFVTLLEDQSSLAKIEQGQALQEPQAPTIGEPVAEVSTPEPRRQEIWKVAFELAKQNGIFRSDPKRLWDLIYQLAIASRPPFVGVQGALIICWQDTYGFTHEKNRSDFFTYWRRYGLRPMD